MTLQRFAWTILAMLLFLTGFVAGRFITLRQLTAASQAETLASAAANLPDNSALPTQDVPGADVAGLPRYPGSTRVEYRQVVIEYLVETEVEYVVATDFERVHEFYRAVFDEEGWAVADLGIYQGEWTFFVISGNREALVELEMRGSLVEIEIEVSQPLLGD